MPTVVFAGFGEPLVHPALMTFLADCKSRGAPVELITNGMLLTREKITAMMTLGLDRLWVSMDGVSEPNGGHDRGRGDVSRLVDNLRHLSIAKYRTAASFPRLGIVFVAMKDNIREFPEVLQLARSLNADRVLVSNLLPYFGSSREQILYARSTWKQDDRICQVILPRLDIHEDAMVTIIKAMGYQDFTDLMGREYTSPLDTCPFIYKASLSVGWDGRVSPCPPLLHSHTCFFQDVERKNRTCSFGSLTERGLLDIWNDPPYAAFRKKVTAFDFSPCVSCASCEWAESNEEDCIGNTFPTCGGCLWAQGLIQCP